MIYNYNNYTTYAKIPISKVRKIDFTQMGQPREAMDSFYARQTDKPDFMINGGFFDWGSGKPILTLKDNGEFVQYESMFVGIGTVDGRLQFGDSRNINFCDFVSAFPTLVVDGNINIGHRPDYNRDMRSAIGYNDEYYFLLTTDARQLEKIGMTFEELAQCMKNIGCKYAIALDGGGSTKLMYKGKAINSPVENRAIDNAICIYLKEEEMTTWKKPNFAGLTVAYVQADKNGNILHKNAVFAWAKLNAEAKGLAIWEVSSQKMIFPENIVPPNTTVANPAEDLLKSLKTQIDDFLGE